MEGRLYVKIVVTLIFVDGNDDVFLCWYLSSISPVTDK